DPTAQRRLADAKQALQKALDQAQLDQNFKDAKQAGEQAMSSGDHNKARDNFQKATELKPKDPTAQRRLADAKQALQKALDQAQLDQNFKDAMQAGESAMSSGDHKKARDNFQKATELKPNDPTAQRRLAHPTHALQKALDQAQLDQNFKDAMQAGESAMSSGDHNIARDSFQKATELKPKDPTAQR